MTNSSFNISTPENVDLHLEPAGIAARIWAAFIDNMLILFASCLLVLVGILAIVMFEQLSLSENTKNNLYYFLAALIILLLTAIQLAYFMVFEKINKGQTPGKRLMCIRTVGLNGAPLNWSSSILRNLMRLIDTNLFLIGVVFMIFDKAERRLGDMLAGTVVIRELKPNFNKELLKVESQSVAEGFIDIGLISSEEYELLLNFLKRRYAMSDSSRSRLAKDLEIYFREKLMPENKGESPENFLEKVYIAFEHNIERNTGRP